MSPVGVFYALLVSSLGLAVTVQAQECSSQPTAGPHTVLSDADILIQVFPDGAKATFKCDIGYEYKGGSRFVTCTAGVWSPLTMICEKRNCGSPGEVQHGVFDFTGTEFGDTAVATCNKGYLMVGNSRRNCLEGGWSGRIPVCEVVKCLAPPEVVDASYSPVTEAYDYGSVVSYRCKSDKELIGSSTIVCSEDGAFKPAPPQCKKVLCDPPNVADAHWDGGARPPYGYRTFVTYKCNAGYDMKGSATVTCNIDSQWEPALPVCAKVPTPTTAPTTTTTTTPPPIPKTTPKSDGRVPGPTKPTNETDDKTKNSGHRIGVGIGIACGVVVVIAGGIIAYIFITKKNRAKRHYSTAGPL